MLKAKESILHLLSWISFVSERLLLILGFLFIFVLDIATLAYEVVALSVSIFLSDAKRERVTRSAASKEKDSSLLS